MEKSKHSIKFERTIQNNGTVQFEYPVSHALQLKPGNKITVTITGGVLSKKLTQHKVTEEEIEQICLTQLEDRENVIRFLTVEGMLSKKKSFKNNLKKLK